MKFQKHYLLFITHCVAAKGGRCWWPDCARYTISFSIVFNRDSANRSELQLHIYYKLSICVLVYIILYIGASMFRRR